MAPDKADSRIPTSPGDYYIQVGRPTIISCFTAGGKLIILNWATITALEVVDIPTGSGCTRAYMIGGRDVILQLPFDTILSALTGG